MHHKIRELPPVCLFIAMIRLLFGKLRLLKEFRGETLVAPNTIYSTVLPGQQLIHYLKSHVNDTQRLKYSSN